MKDYLVPFDLQGDENPSKKDLIAEIKNLGIHIHDRMYSRLDIKEHYKNSYQTLIISPYRYKRTIVIGLKDEDDGSKYVKVNKMEPNLTGDTLASYMYEKEDLNKLSIDELKYIWTELETYNDTLNEIIAKVKMKGEDI